MTDEQTLLIALAKIGADIAYRSLNTIPASEKRGHVLDLQELINRANAQLAAVRCALPSDDES